MLGLLRKAISTNTHKFILLSLLILLINLGGFAFIKDQQIRQTVSDLAFPLDNLLVIVVLIFTTKAVSRKSKRLAYAWGILALAQFLFFIGDFLWAILEVWLKQSPFPSVADIFYVAFYPVYVAGILILTTNLSTSRDWVKHSIDMGIIIIGASLGFWNLLIGTFITNAPGDPIMAQILSIAYPVGDLVLLWALLSLIYNEKTDKNKVVYFFLAFSILIMIVTDSLFSYQAMNDTYLSGAPLDIGWLLTYFFTVIAGFLQIYTIQSDQGVTLQHWGISFSIEKWNKSLVSIRYSIPVIAFVLLVYSHFYQLPMNFLEIAIGVGVMIVLVLLRQMIAINENSNLVSNLQIAVDHVQNQSTELENTNRKLQVEIAERLRAEEQLSYDALHDGLTRLPNRVLFMDRLGRAIEYTKRRSDYPFSVLFLDLDHFKVINDSMGHTAGDKLLIAIGNRLQTCLRSSDTVARLGGDEFVILLENTSEDNAIIHVVNKVMEAVREPYEIDLRTLFVTTSIGIVVGLVDYDCPEDVLRDADIAMYRAKELGKNRFEVFDAQLRIQVISRMIVENDLRHALENQEFELLYQPILSLQSDEIIGFEALIRWHHPERGIILPLEFIPIAEDCGLIIPIGRWVLREACRQLKAWQDVFPKYRELSVNVNISGKQFTESDFFSEIENALHDTGLSPECLKLEITETVIIDNRITASRVFSQIVGLGVQLQIDDFGTGYSALSYIQNFPIQTIKIDKSFVAGMGDSGKSSELIRAIVSMARELGMDTVAEGVETYDQLTELKSLMCKYGQGFLLSRPIPNSSVEKLLARERLPE